MRTALTADELTLLRSEIHGTRLYLGVHKPASIFTARVNGAVVYPLFQIPFDTGSPTSGAIIKSGMTLWIGSAAGLRDKGTMRVRGDQSAAATGNLVVSELGQYAIDIDDNDFLTVVEDYRIGAKFPRYSGGAWLMDYDIAWTDTGLGNNVKPNQEYGPLARLGPAAVGFLESSLCRLRYVGERSAAYSPGNSIGTYAWTFPGTASPATSAAQGTSASPITVDYSAAIPGGRYHGLTVTENTTTKTHVGRRLTFIFERSGANAPYDAEVIGAIGGGPEQGGYTVTVRVINTTADQDDFPDGAHVVLFEEAFYADDAGSGNIDRYFYIDDRVGTFTVSETVTGGTSGATGTVISASTTLIKIRTTKAFHTQEIITGGTSGATARLRSPSVGGNTPYRTEIVLEGWIVDETVHKNPTTGDIEFEIVTVDGVMRGEESYPVALTNRSTTTTLISWEDFYQMTLDRVLLHFCKWRSTIGDVVDVTLHGDLVSSSPAGAEVVKYCDMDQTNLFDQIHSWYALTMLGWVSSDLQSGLYGELDAQIDDTTRAGIPTAWTIAAGDRAGTLEIRRRAHRKSNAQATLYGVDYRTPRGSRSPDDPHDYQGGLEEIPAGIAAPDQATLNLWTGNLRARRNNVYPSVDHRWTGYWRIDAVPQSYIVESLGASDTIRGFVWSSLRLIPRDLRLEYRAGMLLASSDCEGETQGIGGATITFPPVSDPPPAVSPPPEEIGKPPGWVGDASEIAFIARTAAPSPVDHIFWSGDFFKGGQPTYLEVTKPAAVALHALDVFRDGSFMFVADTTNGDIWQTADIGSASPAWTKIMDKDTTAAMGETVTNLGPMRAVGLAVYVAVQTATKYGVGKWDGSAWTFTEVLHFESMDFVEPPFPSHYFGYLTTPIKLRVASLAGTVVDTYNNESANHSAWRRHDAASGDAIKRFAENVGVWTVRNMMTGTNIFTTVDPAGSVLRGALYGDQLCFPDGNGVARIADDGATFAARSTWQAGTILPAQVRGGDTLVWLVKQTAANNVFARISDDGFVTAGTDMTGNFWADLYSGEFNLVDVRLIFR